MPAYATDVYPYPAAMWDEAYDHLQSNRGWTTILLAPPPTPAEGCATATAEMEARGLPDARCLIVVEPFSGSWLIRLSRLTHMDPRWDDVEDHLLNHADASLLTVDTVTVDATAMIDEARAAMAERGLTVGVGLSADATSRMAVLRVERV